MSHKVFNVSEHYLVEIEDKAGFGDTTFTTYWDVYIAVKLNDYVYQGKAIESGGRKRIIPWRIIEEPENGLDAMIKIIKYHMTK